MDNATETLQKKVRLIESINVKQEQAAEPFRQKRVVAYCRVSTQQDEQLNSFEVQKRHYTEKINSERDWCMVGIFADKGISGTSMDKRDEFNKMIRLCKRGKVDMIIVKSISRFARNTLDCIQITRELRQRKVDVFFEEQGIHSIEPSSEFLIAIHGSIAQSESENLSANVKWGKNQSAKEGKVAFRYKGFLGYRKGPDGKPEIVEEEAQIIRYIYNRFLEGDSTHGISAKLEALKVLSPLGNEKWNKATILSILSNEKYKGDAVINKTYVEDCITKKIKINNGERPKYYVENNHPAIIDAITFARVQEELARRNSKKKVKQVGTKTERGKYSSKFALTEKLICGECKTPYRRVTWTSHGKKRIVWRCINRLDFGTKYCHYSPTIEENTLQKAIMSGILQMAQENSEVIGTLKNHISKVLKANEVKDESLELQVRISEIDAEFKRMLANVSMDNAENFDEARAKVLMDEKSLLQEKLSQMIEKQKGVETTQARLEEIYDVVDVLKNHPMNYDDQIVRQVIEYVIIESKDQIKIIFKGGLEITEQMGAQLKDSAVEEMEEEPMQIAIG